MGSSQQGVVRVAATESFTAQRSPMMGCWLVSRSRACRSCMCCVRSTLTLTHRRAYVPLEPFWVKVVLSSSYRRVKARSHSVEERIFRSRVCVSS